jgi:hypothetical protein
MPFALHGRSQHGLGQRQRPTEKIAQNAIISLFVSALDATQFHSTSAKVGEWLSLVEHLVRDQGVGGSNPLSPTNSSYENDIHRCPIVYPC